VVNGVLVVVLVVDLLVFREKCVLAGSVSEVVRALTGNLFVVGLACECCRTGGTAQTKSMSLGPARTARASHSRPRWSEVRCIFRALRAQFDVQFDVFLQNFPPDFILLHFYHYAAQLVAGPFPLFVLL
jgi:hypothetical protein